MVSLKPLHVKRDANIFFALIRSMSGCTMLPKPYCNRRIIKRRRLNGVERVVVDGLWRWVALRVVVRAGDCSYRVTT